MKKEKEEKRSKKAQVTIFVIVAIIIVASIAFVFLFKSRLSLPGTISSEIRQDPRAYIEKCAEKSTLETLEKIMPQGGFLNPVEYTLFDDKKVLFLCYTPLNDQLCSNKHPLLNLEIQEEIKKNIQLDIDKCFSQIKDNLKNNNYQEGDLTINVSLLPKQVKVEIIKPISFSRGEDRISLDKFNIALNSPIYYMLRIANDITNQELSCECGEEACNADINLLNRNNLDFEITKPAFNSKGEEVYRIIETISGEKFNFAIRNCFTAID